MSTQELCDRYRSWFDYEERAHEKVLRSLHTVPAPRRDEPEFQKAVSLVGHIVAARWLWLHRFGFADKGPTEISPESLALEDLDVLVVTPRRAPLERVGTSRFGGEATQRSCRVGRRGVTRFLAG